MQLTKVKVFVV